MTLSVLLIIGAAVVGPIEALPAEESYSQICKRAIRGLGIDVEGESSFASYGEMLLQHADGSREFRSAFGAWAPPKDSRDDWPVRCIPTPEGYRR